MAAAPVQPDPWRTDFAAATAEAQRRGISVYEVCNEVVAGLPPGSTNIVFHPFLYGSNVQPTARRVAIVR